MKLRMTSPSWLTLFPLVGLCACGGTDTEIESTTSQELMLMEQDYAGFDTSDERAAFGQVDAFQRRGFFAEDRPLADPTIERDALASTDGTADLVHYSVSVLWGDRDPDRDAPHRTLWRGGIRVTDARIRGAEAHALERGDVVEHRSRQGIAISTVTHEGDLDGVSFHVLARRDSDGVLAFHSESFSGRVRVSELADLRRMVQTDDGNVVAINAFVVRERPDDLACMRAHVRGHWTPTVDGIAHFRGVAYTPNGRLGHVFGRAADGHFGGKLVDASSGAFVALMRGVYEDHQFRGRVRGREANGFIEGRYGRADARDGGWFAGRIVLCRDGARDEEPSDLPEPRPLPPEDSADNTTDAARPTDG